MKDLCDRCQNAMDGAPDIHMIGCMKGYQVRGPFGNIVKCTGFEQILPVELNVPKRDYELINKNFETIRLGVEQLLNRRVVNPMEGEFEIKEKPSAGVAPYYVSCRFRIKELAQAIARTAVDNPAGKQNDIPTMKLWAKEIIEQCDLIERMKEDEQN